MSDRPSIYFNEVNERQGSFLRRTFLLGGAGFGAVMRWLDDQPRSRPAPVSG